MLGDGGRVRGSGVGYLMVSQVGLAKQGCMVDPTHAVLLKPPEGSSCALLASHLQVLPNGGRKRLHVAWAPGVLAALDRLQTRLEPDDVLHAPSHHQLV